MNRIVRENFPVAELPESLREGLPEDARVSVTIQMEQPEPVRGPSLKELLSVRRPPYRSTEEIVADIRRDRDSWDD